MRRLLLAGLVALMTGISLPAWADTDISPDVRRAFAGRVLFTGQALEPTSRSNKDTIAQFKVQAIQTLTGEPDAEGRNTWRVHCTAFMNAPAGSRPLTLVIAIPGKLARHAARVTLSGIDPTSHVVTHYLTLTEDDDIHRNQSYLIKLVRAVKGREQVLAKGTLQTR